MGDGYNGGKESKTVDGLYLLLSMEALPYACRPASMPTGKPPTVVEAGKASTTGEEAPRSLAYPALSSSFSSSSANIWGSSTSPTEDYLNVTLQ